MLQAAGARLYAIGGTGGAGSDARRPVDAGQGLVALRRGHVVVAELPEELACRRWGSSYRPQPPLVFALAEPRRAGPPATDAGSPPEVLTPGCRRAWELAELAVEKGPLAVFREPDGCLPALWVLGEAVVDAPETSRVPAAWGWVSLWVNLARQTSPPGVAFWLGQRPVGPGLAVVPGRPRHPAPRAVRLREAFDAADQAAARLLASRASRRKGRPPSTFRGQLYLTLAALVYLHPRRPWPPPPLVVVTGGSAARAAGAGSGPDRGAAGAGDGAAWPPPPRPGRVARP